MASGEIGSAGCQGSEEKVGFGSSSSNLTHPVLTILIFGDCEIIQYFWKLPHIFVWDMPKYPVGHSQVFLFLNLPKNIHLLTYTAAPSQFSCSGLSPAQKQGITGGIALELDRGYVILVELLNHFKS